LLQDSPPENIISSYISPRTNDIKFTRSVVFVIMATPSYHRLDAYPSSDQAVHTELYSGNGYDNAYPQWAGIPSDPGRLPLHSDNTYNNPAFPPIDSASKPLVRSTTTEIAHKPSAPPNNRLQERKYQRWKRCLRIATIATKIITILFSSIMFAIMVYTAIKFQTTKGKVRGGRNPWPHDPKVWPTYMLLAGSGFTLLLSVATLFTYCCFDKARRSWKFTVVKYVVHICVWITISAIYRYEKSTGGNDNDLWGWSCSDKADAIQPDFQGVVGFGPLCTMQVSSSGYSLQQTAENLQSSSWEVSLAEIALKIVFAVAHFILYRKTREGEKQRLANEMGSAFTSLVEDF